MSAPTDELDALVARLQDGAARLREAALAPQDAAALVDACAQLAGQASAELERLARAAASEPAPAQDQLL